LTRLDEFEWNKLINFDYDCSKPYESDNGKLKYGWDYIKLC